MGIALTPTEITLSSWSSYHGSGFNCSGKHLNICFMAFGKEHFARPFFHAIQSATLQGYAIDNLVINNIQQM